MDKQDTQKLLQQLGKEAKRRQEEVAAQTRQQRQEELDFAAAVGKVTPLKNSNRVAAPKDNKPLKRRVLYEGWDEELNKVYKLNSIVFSKFFIIFWRKFHHNFQCSIFL